MFLGSPPPIKKGGESINVSVLRKILMMMMMMMMMMMTMTMMMMKERLNEGTTGKLETMLRDHNGMIEQRNGGWTKRGYDRTRERQNNRYYLGPIQKPGIYTH